ncbi:hypothetical protein IC619_015520 [Hazenella sp. IB182353]|uniref:hypothetical protein n=1 Tax=Polycladospora coralii TaxID=2771432 RepID=UPI0017468D39|nr:hypothetical protein [Polycladospora coralii]MBS7531882.1 hypothetical protein [Polycladospora coralii]
MKKKAVVLLLSAFTVTSIFSSFEPEPAEAKVPWTSAAWAVIQKAGNYWYKKSAEVRRGPYADVVESGDIDFNTGSNGASVKHIVNVDNYKYDIYAYSETFPTNWPGKMSIIITNPSGKDVVSKTVTANQRVTMHSGIYGDYTVRFVQNSSQSWNNILVKNTPYRKEFDSQMNMSPSLEGEKPDNTKTEVVYDETGEFILKKPSIEHKTEEQQNKNKNKVFTMNDLASEFYDEVQSSEVHDLKSFDIGSDIKFRDKISSIRYDEAENQTYFGFKSIGDELAEWPFKGDLTKEYSVNSELTLHFKVVSKLGTEFETLDYLNYGFENDGKAPDIKNYLN